MDSTPTKTVFTGSLKDIGTGSKIIAKFNFKTACNEPPLEHLLEISNTEGEQDITFKKHIYY